MDDICPICLKDQETIEHLLLLCPWSKPIWFGAPIGPTSTEMNVTSFPEWLMTNHALWSANGSETDLYKARFMFIIWLIWKTRNDWVFNNVPNPMTTLILAKAQ